MTHKRVLSHCLLCSEELDSMLELQQHLVKHKRRSIQCLYCDKSFLTQTIYRTHLQKEHKNTKYSDIKCKRPIIEDKISIKETTSSDVNNIPGHVIIKEIDVQRHNSRNNSREVTPVNFLRDKHVKNKKRILSGDLLRKQSPILEITCGLPIKEDVYSNELNGYQDSVDIDFINGSKNKKVKGTIFTSCSILGKDDNYSSLQNAHDKTE